MPYASSVVLITSEDKDNKNFGTGFVIDQDGGYSYILTCAHVVRDARGKEGKAKVKVNEVIAEVEAIGTLNGGDDLAVLRVEELFGVRLPGRNFGKDGLSFTSIGYQDASYITVEGKTESGITMPLKGTLGKPISQRIPGQKLSIDLWTLNIDDDVSLEGGYSGAPIVIDTDEGECVIGVLSMQYREQVLAISIEALDRVWQPPYVPFTNRDDEKNLITAYSAPPFYLLDAPAGYGKSRLLQELQKKFLEQKWICAYQVLDSSFGLDKLAEAVAEKLSISGLPPSSEIDKGAGFRLGAALQRYWDNSRTGIVLLFDFDKGFSDFKLLERLLKEFIPEIRDSLKNIAPFNSSYNKFRAVISGRYLSIHYNQLSIQKLPITLSLLNLTPFEYRFIHDSCIAYLNKFTNMRIAEHILYLTGGHPGCMAAVLQWYKESGMPPERFVEEHSDRIWNEIVRLVVTKITNEFPTTFGVHKLMSNNVLRCMDYTVLSKLIETLEISEVRNVSKLDEYVLADKLTGTALLNRKNYLLHDDITRRLICLGLRNDRREEFVRLCQIAETICEERLRDNSKPTPTPDKWTIEYLFQSLQQHALLISTSEQRRELRTIFISQELPKALRWLVTGREVRAQKSYLLDSIEEDWEFKFTVNYYLRHTEYNNDVVEELISEVNVFFEKLGKA